MKETALRDHRRAHLRFEVMGAMAGAVVSTQTLQVVNLGASGALVEASCPLPENAEYLMQLVLERHVSEANVKVRRVTELRPADGIGRRYRMGLEFLSITPEAEDEINRMVVASLSSRLSAGI
jgi:hypothetical protein